jgi:hypothetical protein
VIKDIDFLESEAYTTLANISLCRLMNGMWQVSGMHGYNPSTESAVAEMAHCIGELLLFHPLRSY